MIRDWLKLSFLRIVNPIWAAVAYVLEKIADALENVTRS